MPGHISSISLLQLQTDKSPSIFEHFLTHMFLFCQIALTSRLRLNHHCRFPTPDSGICSMTALRLAQIHNTYRYLFLELDT